MGKQIKFMGSSHIHTLEKGDNFGGRLGEGIPKKVVFDTDNSWVVDAAEVGLTDAAVDVLIESGDFKDVTGMERIPTNLHQQIFLSMPASEKVAAVADADEEKPEDDEPATDPDAGSSNPRAQARRGAR